VLKFWPVIAGRIISAIDFPGERSPGIMLLDRLNERNGQTLSELCAGLDMARQSVSKHLSVLEAANLVTTVWRGREKLHYLNPEPINAIADRWISRYDRERGDAAADDLGTTTA
jgi:DNA-binding transcriptional ArsR family regulator